MVVDAREDVAFRQLVDIAKLRWRIERDYQELKQEVGLGHFEGRGWRGFHHHATLCIAAYGYLISERETIPPSGDRATTLYPQFALREGHLPKGTLPLRPERHVPNSIATMRRRLVATLATTLSRCPCCAARIRQIVPLLQAVDAQHHGDRKRSTAALRTLLRIMR